MTERVLAKAPPARRDKWGPFRQPLFEDPSARALSRVGVVDVGSNSVRLVVFDGAARSPAYFYNEKIMCGLGIGLGRTGRLHPKGRKRALAALRRFQLLADAMELAPLAAVATAAVREASDGADFCDEVEAETGLRLYVIDGQQEARLSAQGVLLGWPDAKGLVCDIGGSSMELAAVSGGEVGKCISSDLGPLKLQNISGGQMGRKSHIKTLMERLCDHMGRDHGRLFLVGGSWRAIARLDMERRSYPLRVLHEYRMTPKNLRETLNWIADNDLSVLGARIATSKARMSLVPLAGEVLHQLVESFQPTEIAISAYGIREGMLYEQMPEHARRRDPLIEACRYAEARDSRRPGFGRALFNFLEPLFITEQPPVTRLIKAACLLHDVNWRAHPDTRAEVCFDNATRANLGGLTHQDRIWLGLALMHRYENDRNKSRLSEFLALLDDSAVMQAEVVGKAMRLGAMFCVADPQTIARLNWLPNEPRLTLSLTQTGNSLFGEVAQARFLSLASSLDAEPVVRRR